MFCHNRKIEAGCSWEPVPYIIRGKVLQAGNWQSLLPSSRRMANGPVVPCSLPCTSGGAPRSSSWHLNECAPVGRHPGQKLGIHPRPRPWPSAAGVSFPKTVAPFGFWNIHDCYHRNPLNVKRLSKTEALYNR